MDTLFLAPKEIMESMEKASESKLALPFSKVILLGILAGAYIAFGAHFSTTAITGTQEFMGFGITKLVGGAAFSLGLMLVIVAGAELFTGNMLHSLGWWQGTARWHSVLKAWGYVYIANLIGALLIALLVFFSGLNGTPEALSAVGKTAVSIATAKATLPFLQIFIRGILANWLVCLAVMLAAAGRDISSKLLGCFFPIMAFVAMGCEHSVANMYFLPAGMLLSPSIPIQGAMINIAASTLGNMVGGIVFVWTIYWFIYLRKLNP